MLLNYRGHWPGVHSRPNY